MNRGSSDGGSSGCSTTRSFNEAPIHESGKCLPRARGQPGHLGFNEAPIHESGKFATAEIEGVTTFRLQ